MVKKHFSKSYPFRLSENIPLWFDLQTSTATGSGRGLISSVLTNKNGEFPDSNIGTPS